jgi:Acetyltransferase (GNAT) domain
MKPQTNGNGMSLRTIRDLREVETLRELWKSWRETRDSDIDYFSGVIRSRGECCRPHVIVLSRNSRPDALLVGLSDRTKVALTLGPVTVCRPKVNMLQFPHGCLLGNASSENSAEFVRRVVRSLTEGEADVALWEHLDVKSPLYTCALQLPKLLWRDHCPGVRDHWLMNFPKGLDEFLSSLGRSQRSKLSRKCKRVQSSFAGEVQLRSFRTIVDLEQAIPDMEQIARKSIKRQLGLGFFDTPQAREQLLLEATNGWLRIYILYIEGKPVSFWKGILYERCLQADQTGFDAAWSTFSPGIFLFLQLLEDLKVEDIRTVDFGYWHRQLHRCFGSVRRPEASVQICAPRLRALQFHLLRDLMNYLNILLRAIPSLKWAAKIVWKRKQAAALKRVCSQSGYWTFP